MTNTGYVHGYSTREWERLTDQGNALSELLHQDTKYPAGSAVLECGCGTGAQTVFLASRNPEARIVSVDVSAASLEQARRRIQAAGHRHVEFHQASIFELPFDDAHFDHVFLCFVLEHLAEPATALKAVQRVLRREGSITVIEGDHGSWFCYPQTAEASRAVQCLVEVQAKLGGDSLIGAPSLSAALGDGLSRSAGESANHLCGQQPSRTGGERFQEHVHCDGRGRPRSGSFARTHR